MEEAKWYVIHTYSGYENKVKSDLEKIVENRKMQDLIQEFYIPTETVRDVKGEKVKEYERKIFPGYVLVKMIVTEDSWYVVRNTHGVTGFVGPASKPVPLTDEEVENLGVEKHSVELTYKVGDSIRVVYGPFESMEGVVEEIDIPANSVRVLLTVFGRQTPVDMDLDQIALVD
ncbi:MAG: transcription termination/antitermination factor NusG [Clostridiales bacterium]|nr:transcription termination/antitermination factor NusG [Candidatus Equinaster intestinalis]